MAKAEADAEPNRECIEFYEAHELLEEAEAGWGTRPVRDLDRLVKAARKRYFRSWRASFTLRRCAELEQRYDRDLAHLRKMRGSIVRAEQELFRAQRDVQTAREEVARAHQQLHEVTVRTQGEVERMNEALIGFTMAKDARDETERERAVLAQQIADLKGEQCQAREELTHLRELSHVEKERIKAYEEAGDAAEKALRDRLHGWFTAYETVVSFLQDPLLPAGEESRGALAVSDSGNGPDASAAPVSDLTAPSGARSQAASAATAPIPAEPEEGTAPPRETLAVDPTPNAPSEPTAAGSVPERTTPSHRTPDSTRPLGPERTPPVALPATVRARRARLFACSQRGSF